MNPSSDTRDFGIFWPTVGDTRDTHTKPKTLSTHIHDTEFAHSHAPVGGRTSILAEETHKNFKNEKRDTLCARREVGGVQRWRGRPEAVARWRCGDVAAVVMATAVAMVVGKAVATGNRVAASAEPEVACVRHLLENGRWVQRQQDDGAGRLHNHNMMTFQMNVASTTVCDTTAAVCNAGDYLCNA